MRASRFLLPLVLAAGSARAESLLPTHSAESGYLDVPSAEGLNKGGAAFAFDLRYVRSLDAGQTVVPSPMVMLFGLGRGEAGFSLRQSGLPGDPRPPATIPALAGKLTVLDAKAARPGVAGDLLLDRINRTPTIHLRAIVTSQRYFRTRASLFGGGVIGLAQGSGFAAGAALSVVGPRQTDLVLEAVRQPAGRLIGVAVRWQPRPALAVGLLASYLPDDARTLSAGLTLALLHPAPVAASHEAAPEPEVAETRPAPEPRPFTDERPRFPLRLRERPPPGEEGGPAPHYPSDGGAP